MTNIYKCVIVQSYHNKSHIFIQCTSLLSAKDLYFNPSITIHCNQYLIGHITFAHLLLCIVHIPGKCFVLRNSNEGEARKTCLILMSEELPRQPRIHGTCFDML